MDREERERERERERAIRGFSDQEALILSGKSISFFDEISQLISSNCLPGRSIVCNGRWQLLRDVMKLLLFMFARNHLMSVIAL